MCSFRRRQTDDWECSFDFVRRHTSLSGRGGGDVCILNGTGRQGSCFLPIVMLGLVASAVGQTNPNRLAREQSRYLSRAMNHPVDWYPWSADQFKRKGATPSHPSGCWSCQKPQTIKEFMLKNEEMFSLAQQLISA
jgi:hypothetical protein